MLIKWPGGKRRLIPQLRPYVPNRFVRYIEPCLGSGALFFSLRPPMALLADLNPRLITMYTAVKHKPKTVHSRLEALADEYMALDDREKKSDMYYRSRKRFNSPNCELSITEQAALFLFLNKSCYNGLYRVNQKGEFNVPHGRYNYPAFPSLKSIMVASAALTTCTTLLLHDDFSRVALMADPGDFVYFDPPYVPVNDTSFTGYTVESFGLEDHRRIVDLMQALTSRGVFVMVSNSDCPTTRSLFAPFYIHQIEAPRSINSDPNGRGCVSELVITNYEVLHAANQKNYPQVEAAVAAG